ncbi:Protein of unknown function, partial [Cotesia congregata]
VEGSRKSIISHYGLYQNSYSCSNAPGSIYGYPTTTTTTTPTASYLPAYPHFQSQFQLNEDYRPIYFYVAQPYTIPYTFAKRPKSNNNNNHTLSIGRSTRSRSRVKFSKKLSNAEFSQKVKQGEFSKSLNQVQFVDSTVKTSPKELPRKPVDPAMTSMFRRGTIFATFFLSLIGGGLVCAALVTQHWVEAKAWRTPNPHESAGKIHFGLLNGKKELNVAYGWRTYHITAAGLSALIAVLNTATTPRVKLLSVPGVYIINSLTLILCITSVSTWLAQFYTKLQNNVLPKEDVDNMWTSEGSAELGYSFWMVVSAGVVHLISIALVGWGSGRVKEDRIEHIPALEEKTAAAIMLY